MVAPELLLGTVTTCICNMEYLIFFILGTFVGSFSNVVASRLHTGLSIVGGRSRCGSCGHELGFLDLIPLISFFVTGGRCRHCGSSYALSNVFIELSFGLMFLAMFVHFGLSQAFVLYTIFWSLMFIVAIYDMRHTIIPMLILYPAVALALFIWYTQGLLLYSLAGALLVAGFILAIFLVSRGRAMGFGDVPLSFTLSLAVGFPALVYGILFSFWIGAIIGIIILLFVVRKVTMGIEVPFAPFLIAGFLCSQIFLDKIIQIISLGLHP